MKLVTPRSLVSLGVFCWLLAGGAYYLGYVHNDGAVVELTNRMVVQGQATSDDPLTQVLTHLREITWALCACGGLSFLAAVASRAAARGSASDPA